MRILDKDGNEVVDPDLSIGYLSKETILKPDAVPPNDADYIEELMDPEFDRSIVKFSYSDDDYEEILRYVVLSSKDSLLESVRNCKNKLSETDYITAKAMDALIKATSITEFLSILSTFRTEYGEVIAEREEWRKKINECELSLAGIEE